MLVLACHEPHVLHVLADADSSLSFVSHQLAVYAKILDRHVSDEMLGIVTLKDRAWEMSATTRHGNILEMHSLDRTALSS